MAVWKHTLSKQTLEASQASEKKRARGIRLLIGLCGLILWWIKIQNYFLHLYLASW